MTWPWGALVLVVWATVPAWARSPAPVLQGVFRGRPVTYAIVNGRAIFEGDIILDHVTRLPQRQQGVRPEAVGVAYAQYLWPAGTQGVAEIPYIITSPAQQLNAALSAFNATFAGVIQFVPRGSQTDYVNFDFNPSNLSGQCESNVGRVGGEQTTGGSAACSLGTLLHEMGHVVGLYHEQSRPDRNTYLTVNTGNVIKGSEANFSQLSDNFQDLGLFDYGSVMEYIAFAFTRNGGPVIETIPPGMPLSNQTGYTAADIDGVQRLYGVIPKNVTVTSNPPGLSVIVDGGAVTTPHTFAWTLRSTHTLSVAATAQTLGGATYVYGRWNDNTAAAHTITVAPGNNRLTQPRTRPAVTVYTANFVQLSAYTAAIYPAGAGTVSANPPPQSYAGASGQFFVARQPVTLTATPSAGYQFVTWAGTSAPWSADPKPDTVPDGGAAYAVTAEFSTQPVTTITTNPGGFWFTVDGNYYKGPQSFTADLFTGWTPGSVHVLTGYSPSQPYSINTQYVFDGWSDGGALSHDITLPQGASTVIGTFTAQYVPIANANPSCAAVVSLTPGSPNGFYAAGTPVTVAEKPVRGLKLTGWTGDLSGKTPSQVLTVNDEELAVANFNVTATPFAVRSLSPATFPAGSAGGTVKVLGTGFASGSAVFVNNAYRASTFVGAKEIDVALTATDLMTAGAFPIGVSNYPSGGSCGNYGAVGFFVTR